ncbi:MAG: hypothetical protein EHM28_12150, partial [Spirochaetaceae bacterium]
MQPWLFRCLWLHGLWQDANLDYLRKYSYKLNMSTRKLSPEEISRTVAKIREKYGEYHYKYFKSTTHKSNFEDRYVQALKRGVDISSFLLAEISAIEELITREEEKVLSRRINVKSGPEKSFADQIIE